jgi:uncharacterized SAM-binding protein YcdF (DUF218 family)
LRSILILRGVLATGFVVLGIVLLARGEAAFGLLALGFGVTNAVLVVMFGRRLR